MVKYNISRVSFIFYLKSILYTLVTEKIKNLVYNMLSIIGT